MRWFWKRKKSKLPVITDELIKEDKILSKLDTNKVKGGKANKTRIWNGCGGMIPQ